MAGYFKSRNKRQDKRLRELSKLSKWRQRKAEIRQERIAEGLLEQSQQFEKWHRFEFGVRDKQTGEVQFTDLKSVRHAAKSLGLILKFYT